MASLSQALRGQSQLTRGPGGALQEDKTAQQKANQLGLAAAPTTPGGATMIGANLDQAKMAGTPAQLSAALNKSATAAQPQNTLQTALRQQQSRTQATGMEQQKMQKSADMQALGGLGDRVTNFIDTQRQLIASQRPVGLQAQAPAAGQPDISAELALLKANPADQNVILAINTKLGKDINSQLTGDQIRQMYTSDIDTISQAGTGAVANNMTVSNLFSDPQFGYDANSLSQLLGVPEAELSNYTVDQLQEKINQVTTQEFNQSAQLEQDAYNPLAGQAERQLAQQAGREASTTGIRATEADTARLNESIQKGDVVSFGGKTMQLADALDDENISGLIKEYIEGDENFKKQIEQSEPQLAKFIKDNQAVLADVTKQLEAGATTFAETQAYNLGLNKVGNITLSDEVMKVMLPAYGTLAASKIDPTKIPGLQYVKTLTPDGASAFGNALNTAVANKLVDPKEFAGLSVDQIKKLQPGVSGSNWDTYLRTKQDAERVRNLDPKNTDAAVSEIFEGNLTRVDLEQAIAEGNTVSALGYGSKVDLSSVDANSDGIPDWDNMHNIAMANHSTMSLSEAAEGKQPKAKLKLNRPQPFQPGTVQHGLVQKLKGLSEDGHVSTQDFENAGLSLEEMAELAGRVNQGFGNIDPAVKYMQQRAVEENTRQIVAKAKSGGQFMDVINNMINTQKTSKRGVHYSPVVLQEEAGKLLTDSRELQDLLTPGSYFNNIHAKKNKANNFLNVINILEKNHLAGPALKEYKKKLLAIVDTKTSANTKGPNRDGSGRGGSGGGSEGGHAGSGGGRSDGGMDA